MSYLFVVIIGSIAGWTAGQYVKGSEMGIVPDLIAGAAGAGALVLFSRIIGFGGAFVVTALVATIGGVAMLYAMRYAMAEKAAVPVVRSRRH